MQAEEISFLSVSGRRLFEQRLRIDDTLCRTAKISRASAHFCRKCVFARRLSSVIAKISAFLSLSGYRQRVIYDFILAERRKRTFAPH